MDDYHVDDAMLQAMAQVIVREIDPERIILFGSRAHTEPRPDADVDLLVIDKRSFGEGRSRRKEAARLWRALSGFPPPIDLLLYSNGEVDEYRDFTNHVVARALREGRVIYEAPACN